MKLLGGRISIPDHTAALLWDMDGVLLDTLQLDFDIVNQLLAEHLPDSPTASRELIRANFAYSTPDFWRRIIAGIGSGAGQAAIDRLVESHDRVRITTSAPVHEGVVDILQAARADGLRMAVVSNNPSDAIAAMLVSGSLHGYFDSIVGNDIPGLAKKPAPDTYLEAARRLSVDPAKCVVIEDSVLGAEAGSRAGCYTIGVATGANSLDDLSRSQFVNSAYASLWLAEGA